MEGEGRRQMHLETGAWLKLPVNTVSHFSLKAMFSKDKLRAEVSLTSGQGDGFKVRLA